MIQKKRAKRKYYVGEQCALLARSLVSCTFDQSTRILVTDWAGFLSSDGASSPNSLASAAMDESDSDAEPTRSRAPAVAATGTDDDKYPVDGMYVSQAEKQEIMSMREVEREQIIAERISEIERQRQNRLLRQMVSSVENEERKQPKKKRSADTADLEDGSPRASRQRTGKGETAMDTLRRVRAEKARRKEDKERRRDAYSPGQRDSPERDGSDGDFGRDRTRSPEAEAVRDLPPPELKDFDRVRLGRNEFAQVCFTPGFESAITGCFIRIALGPHPETGVEQYRMAAIKGTTARKLSQASY
jgi:RNA polymerase-associated protein RTF1